MTRYVVVHDRVALDNGRIRSHGRRLNEDEVDPGTLQRLLELGRIAPVPSETTRYRVKPGRTVLYNGQFYSEGALLPQDVSTSAIAHQLYRDDVEPVSEHELAELAPVDTAPIEPVQVEPVSREELGAAAVTDQAASRLLLHWAVTDLPSLDLAQGDTVTPSSLGRHMFDVLTEAGAVEEVPEGTRYRVRDGRYVRINGITYSGSALLPSELFDTVAHETIHRWIMERRVAPVWVSQRVDNDTSRPDGAVSDWSDYSAGVVIKHYGTRKPGQENPVRVEHFTDAECRNVVRAVIWSYSTGGPYQPPSEQEPPYVPLNGAKSEPGQPPRRKRAMRHSYD